VTPDDLTSGRMNEADVDLLGDLVLRIRTADQVTAISEGLLELGAASDDPASVPGWDDFIRSPSALRLARTASRLGVRPSTLLGVGDEVVAYLLDEATGIVEQVADAQVDNAAAAGLAPGEQIAPDSVYEDGPISDAEREPTGAELAALEAVAA